MTIDEIRTLDLEALERRAEEIAEETRTADADQLEAITAELDAIEERKNVIIAEMEQRRADEAAVINGAGKVLEKSAQEVKNPMERRNSKEYLDAWVEMQKGRATQEQRVLLTENATENGTIAVPVYVEEKVNTAWGSNEIMRRVKKSYFKGNVKVPVEVSASGAVIHAEGGAAITEEELVIEFVNLIPQTIKKMVRYSTEVMDLKGQSWIDYIFDEIEYQLVKFVADLVVTQLATSSYTDAYEDAGAALTTADVVIAEGYLGGEATNPVLITTRETAAALKAAALSAGYGYDPFDGMDVIYTSSTALGSNLAIIADLSCVQVNFPNGEQPTFVFDEYTDAPSDIVRVIGRIMAAVGVVASGKAVVIPAGE